MGKHTSYYELREALAEDGCPVCRLARRTVERFLDYLIYENVNNPGVREDIRQARGFCNLHAWQLRDVRGALGMAIIHRDVLETLMRQVEAAEYRQNSWQRGLNRVRTTLGSGPACEATTDLVADLTSQQACPACRVRDSTETMCVHTLLEYMDDAELGPALRRSAGLCLPHFRLALQQVPDEATFKTLVEIQLDAWKRLRDELSELIRKQDYRFRNEGLGAEGDSWIRAIAQISGMRGVR
jgi:hypothetical protein